VWSCRVLCGKRDRCGVLGYCVRGDKLLVVVKSCVWGEREVWISRVMCLGREVWSCKLLCVRRQVWCFRVLCLGRQVWRCRILCVWRETGLGF